MVLDLLFNIAAVILRNTISRELLYDRSQLLNSGSSVKPVLLMPTMDLTRTTADFGLSIAFGSYVVHTCISSFEHIWYSCLHNN